MKNNDNIYKYTIYGIIFIIFLSIILNGSTRKFFSYITAINKLEKQINLITIENNKYKKRLNYLKTNPKELEKVVKTDVGDPKLGVLSKNEMEYVFLDEEKEVSD